MDNKLKKIIEFSQLKVRYFILKSLNKKRIVVIVLTIVFIAYILGFAVIFNLKDVLGIGHYKGEKTIPINTEGDYGGVKIRMYANHLGYNDHHYSYSIMAFSGAAAELDGISYINYRVATSASLKENYDINYSTPIKSITYEDETRLYQNDNLTIKGFADIAIIINEANETYRVDLNHGIIIELDGEELNYEWGNISTILNVIYLAFTTFPLMFLYRNIKSLKFKKWYGENIRDRDGKFLDILKNQHKRKFD